ncbi:MAG: pyridoxal-phosphate dependent enzyme [Pseudomonadota bacterium]
MKLTTNPYFNSDKTLDVPAEFPFPSTDSATALSVSKACLPYAETPLHDAKPLAEKAGVGKVYLKDETGRMGLGSFKALGAAYVIAHQAAATGKSDLSDALSGRTYVTASAGNHGLSVAFGAGQFGANSVIFLAETVPAAFADRLREHGAAVQVEGSDYGASMEAAAKFADENGFTLLSDSSWDGYYQLPHRLMEGYLAAAHEITEQMPEVPTHIFLQAGVGGLAGAMAAYFRHAWGNEPEIIVVEPDFAPALQASVERGECTFADGPVSNMGRLDCKEPSIIALKGLARDANYFLTISDELASATVKELKDFGVESTESGVAGLAAVFAGSAIEAVKLDKGSKVLCIISEGAE